MPAALLLLPLLLFLLCGFTEAESSIAEEAGMDTLSHEVITESELTGETPIVLWDKLTDLFRGGTGEAIGSASGSFAALLGILVICSLLHALKHLSASAALSDACSFVTALALSGVSYALLSDLFQATGQALTAFTEYLASLLPVSASLLIAGGNISAAATASAGFSLFLSAVSLLCSSILFPFLQIAFAISFASALPGTVDLSPVGSLVRNTSAVLLAFLFSMLGFLLTMQTTIAAASDNALFRTVRFASGVLIPVVGNVLGDAARTIAGSVSVIKGTVGAVGTTVTFAILLPPFLKLAFHRIMLSVCAALAKLLGCEREGQLLSELGSTLSILLGLLAGAEIVTLLYLATFIKTGVSI